MTISKRVLLAAAALLAFSIPASAANMIGNCEVTGEKGSSPIATPAKAGQLTVEVSLPAPIWWNGDTPESIKDGLEYCDFSVPYFSSDIGVLVRKDAPVDEKSIKTAKIGVQQATTGAAFVQDKLGITDVQVYPDQGDMFAALRAGQTDVAVTDTSIVLAEVVANPDKVEVIGQYKTGESYGAIYPKGNANNPTLDKIIQSMIDDGTVKKLGAKYLAAAWGKDPATVPYFNP